MRRPKLGCFKGFFQRRSRDAKIPMRPDDDAGSSPASASQSSPSSTHLRIPNPLMEQPQATGSIPSESVTPSRASSPAATPTTHPHPPTAVLVPRPRAGHSLWDRAYEALREDDPHLLDRYEKLLSKELPASIVSTTQTSPNPSSQVESLDELENRINSDPCTRRDQLKGITDRGMEQTDRKRIKYVIFGHELVLKDQISQVSQFVTAMKVFVSEAVKVSPEASLAWAGVCVLLPVFTNPSAAEEANRNGLSYVTSRIRYYVELEHLLWPENLESKELRGEVEGHIVDLYQKILDFQIKTVLRFYRKWLANVSLDVIGFDDWKGMVSKIKGLEQAVRDESNTVNTIASRKRLGDIHDAAEQHNKELQSLLSVAEEQLAEQKRTNQILEDPLLDLPVVYEACYDSTDVQDSPKCDGGTRIRVRDSINRWAEEDSGEPLLWLVGPAGTGKSTIARTVAESFLKEDRLAAGYFFKRGDQGRNDTSRLFPTLAFQMSKAKCLPSFKRCLLKHLDGLDKDAVEKKALEFQFDKLFRLPLADLPPGDTKELPKVIVIDALDECERPEHLAGILSLLSELQKITQVRLRVMLTSRPARSIADAFDPLLENKTARRIEIHREFLEDTKKDIRIFLESNFATIKTKCRVKQDPWPLAKDLERLIQLATSPEPLFIYAATLCRFVYDQQQPRNPKKQLDRWLEQCEDNKSQLHQIYSPILAQVFAGNNTAESEQQLQFLGALVLLKDPLPASSLAALLAIDTDDVTWWLPELHAVLDIPSESHKPLRLLHKSFSDFLLDSDDSSASPYRVDVADTHRLLAEKCLQRMEAGLQQDICNVRKLDASIDSIGSEEIGRCIPADLKYACLHWVYHLQGSGQPLGAYIHTFFHEHFLHWLEVLSLLRRLPDGALAIRGLLELTKHSPDTPLEFVDLMKDAKRVFSSFGSTIEHYPLQTYGALLFFTPVASRVRQMFWNQRMPRLGPIQGVKLDWDAHLQTLGHDNFVIAVAFSPDSQVIASGSFDRTVKIWSSTTGALLQTLEGHSGAVEVVVFSDNETMASGSRDGTVRIWNLPTGKLLHTLNEQDAEVTAVVFLPDGEHLASASTNRESHVSIRLWNLKTGAPPKELFQSCRRDFQRIGFSHDSQLMASRMRDKTIKIWNFPAGSHRCTLKGHDKSILTMMVFSSNNQLLASGSFDDTLRLWNMEDGVQIYALESRIAPVNAIAFSPDDRLLATSWTGAGIRIWNAANGTPEDTLSGHQATVTTVAFSPDGQLLASGSNDRTIKLWDAEMRTHQQPVERHSNKITTVTFSPDGQLVATSSRDRTVRLWDVLTGICLRTLNSNHDAWGSDVNFSPDGKLLASFDGSVRIWNVENGTLQQRIDEKNGLITAVDYSTNGQLAASASFNTVTLHNPATGVYLFTLEGHGESVEQIVFSPDGQFLASSTRNIIVRLWETNTGMLRHVFRKDQTRYMHGLFFSPNSQFLACVYRNNIVLWDVMLGLEQRTLRAGLGVSTIAFSPNNQLLAITRNDYGQYAIVLWDLTNGKRCHRLKFLDMNATDILFSPDSQIVAVAVRDRTVWLWDATTHSHILTIDNPNDFVTKLQFSPDGQILATASRDKMVRLWNTTTGSHLQVFRYGTGFVRGINFLSEELQVVVSESSDPMQEPWSCKLWGPITVEIHNFSLTAASSGGMSEPNISEMNLDATEEWITKGSERLIWLPPEYRPTRRDRYGRDRMGGSWARKGSTIFIGCPSGRLLRVQGT